MKNEYTADSHTIVMCISTMYSKLNFYYSTTILYHIFIKKATICMTAFKNCYLFLFFRCTPFKKRWNIDIFSRKHIIPPINGGIICKKILFLLLIPPTDGSILCCCQAEYAPFTAKGNLKYVLNFVINLILNCI